MCFQRQLRPLLDVHVHSPDPYTNGKYHGSSSPNREYHQNSAQTHVSPGPTSQAYRQRKGFGNQSNQQYYNRNQSDNCSQGYAAQGQNRTRPGPQYAMNQNFDIRTQHNFMQQGDPNNYPSSPTNARLQPQYTNQFYEGMPQVYVIPSSPGISDGLARGLITNPLFNIPVNVTPSIPVPINSSMAPNHLYQPSLTGFATSPSAISLLNNGVPVCTPGWFPTLVPVSVCEEQTVAYGQEVNCEQESLVEKNDGVGQQPEVPFYVAFG